MADNKKINLSFKNTDRDIRLYLRLQEERDKSNFIKTAIEFYLDHLEKGKK